MLGLGLSKFVPIVLYFMAIGVGFIAVFYKVELGLLFLVPLLPLQNVLQKIHKLPQGHNFVDFLIICMLIGWILQRIIRGEKVFVASRLNFLLLTYIILTGFALLNSYFQVSSAPGLNIEDIRLVTWKNHILLPILCLLTLNNVRDSKYAHLLIAVILVSIFLSDFSFQKSFKWVKTFHYSDRMRISGSFSYLGPNEIAAFFAQYLMVILGILLLDTRKSLKALLSILCVFNFYCLMYTYSRAGYLAFALAMTFLLYIRSKKYLFLFLILLFFSSSLLPTSVTERIQMTFLTEDDRIEAETSVSPATDGSSVDEQVFDSSAQGRIDNIWKPALDSVASHPLFGKGYLSFQAIHGFDPHNNYLKFLVDLGLIGLSFYLYLYYYSFSTAVNLYRHSTDRFSKGLGLGFSACIIANMILNTTHDNWTYMNLMSIYWVLLALVEIARMNLPLRKIST